MDRIVIDVSTGQSQIVQLSPEEEAEAIARNNAIEAIEAPRRARLAADEAEKADAKQSTVVKYLVSHTNAEILQYVGNVANLADLKTIVGHLAVAVAVLARRELR